MITSEENDIKLQEKLLYEEYKKKLAELKKSKDHTKSIGHIFTKGLLPIYVLYILSIGPTNGNDISHKISERTHGQWQPSTGGIYPLLTKLEKEGLVQGTWDNPDKRVQKIFSLTEEGLIAFEERKNLLKPKIDESLNVLQIIFCDLYN